MDVTQRLVSRSCPFCQNSAEDAQVLSYGNSEWPMIECNKCHFVYLKRAPVYERLSEEFAWEKPRKPNARYARNASRSSKA